MRYLNEVMKNSFERRSRQETEELSNASAEAASHCKRLEKRIAQLEQTLKEGGTGNDNTP